MLVLHPASIESQEPEVFVRSDFDLNGKVKSCLVITDYGKEEFDFNEEGLLTKSITRYNDQDYEVTYYKFQGNDLKERRDEIYRDGVFDKQTSIAHFYTADTSGRKKITEKIFSYDQEFLDKYEYYFDGEDRLVKTIRSNNNNLDEKTVEFSNYKDERTVSYLLNGVIQRSVRSSARKQKDGSHQKIELTKEFLEGEPTKAVEKVYDVEEKLISQQNFNYDSDEKSFVPTKMVTYQYDENGMLSSLTTKIGDLEDEKEFIYQFDNGDPGNWVKKIVTPENSYTTRIITYYKPVKEVTEN
jgi:hypothetical protein